MFLTANHTASSELIFKNETVLSAEEDEKVINVIEISDEQNKSFNFGNITRKKKEKPYRIIT